jgi:hypothetical protein
LELDSELAARQPGQQVNYSIVTKPLFSPSLPCQLALSLPPSLAIVDFFSTTIASVPANFSPAMSKQKEGTMGLMPVQIDGKFYLLMHERTKKTIVDGVKIYGEARKKTAL